MHSAFPQTLPWMRVAASQGILALIVEKGSICIDGISLTVAALDDDSFQVSIIPHTGSETTLLTKAVGDPVNLENDVVGKYVQRLLQPAIAATKPQESRITMEFLAESLQRQKPPFCQTGLRGLRCLLRPQGMALH